MRVHIALDYDDTYTRDPNAWNEFIDLMHRNDHTVYCVTMRYPNEAQAVRDALGKRVDGIFCTGRKAKRPFMFARGIRIDVWIDDEPSWIITDAADAVQLEPQ
jgi:hypothetical protein